jgi:hypothetical protein
MNFSLITILALATTAQADLTSKWNINYVTTAAVDNTYTFTYDTLGDGMVSTNMAASVYDKTCEGTVFAEVSTAGVVTDSTEMGATMTNTASAGSGADDGTATVVVTMVPDLAAASSIWTLGSDGTGSGTMEFCVRYGLFAGTNEINFSETLVTLAVTMDGGFTIDSVLVAEKEKTTSTQTQEYSVDAALCAGTVPDSGSFLQGSLVCVKVTPSNADVEISAITSFTWTNGVTSQVALADSVVGDDALTSIDSTDQFSTILYAQFYESGIAVSGTGSANLGFKVARRLGSGSDGRSLQDLGAADAVQDFSIVADIVKSDDSPTALQTAGGATASFVVTIFGLVGAVLLA